MSVFSARDRKTLRDMLTGLHRPVGILAFAPRHASDGVQALLDELMVLADGRIHGQWTDPEEREALAAALGVSASPTFRFIGPTAEIAPVEMVGLPSGYQFGAFLNLLLALNRGRLYLNHSVSGAVKNLSHDVVLEVVVSATCPNCPEVVRLVQQCAMANPARVFARSLDAAQHPDLVPAGVDAVPYTRIFVDSRLMAEKVGMMSSSQLWHLIQAGTKGEAQA
ncbi:MAG: hypothetical protein M1272_08305 [Firmicutes bacterium]|nr:hypothetical protein [Bacillota bacterium]